MTRSTRPFRLLSAPLAALLLSSSMVVPALEAFDSGHVPVAESEHEPGSCPTPHDHSVCTQVGANHAAPGAERPERPIEITGRLAVAIVSDDRADSGVARTRPARAPPTR